MCTNRKKCVILVSEGKGVIRLAQQSLNLTVEKDKLRRELYTLLSQGRNKDGESNHSLFEQEVLSCGDIFCERGGLYY